MHYWSLCQYVDRQWALGCHQSFNLVLSPLHSAHRSTLRKWWIQKKHKIKPIWIFCQVYFGQNLWRSRNDEESRSHPPKPVCWPSSLCRGFWSGSTNWLMTNIRGWPLVSTLALTLRTASCSIHSPAGSRFVTVLSLAALRLPPEHPPRLNVFLLMTSSGRATRILSSSGAQPWGW